MGAWQANGCMTQARQRDLDAHLNQQRGPHQRIRPGSDAWPELRRRLEAHDATGAPPLDPTHHACHTCTAHTPSRRTLQRRHTERRRLGRPRPLAQG
jgi:hypothetical protein